MSAYALFATCPRGLEAVLAAELERCGARSVKAASGGVACAGDLALCYRANLESRIATRVLLELGRARYRNEQEVYEAACGVRWQDWFEPERSIRVDVTAIRSPLKSLDFITLKIKDAVCDRFRAERGRRPDVDTRSPQVRIAAFLDAREVTLYLDTSGEPLYKRGYRGDAGEAPLKENLAAGILALSGWRPEEPFLDPMCGSGTLAIEAAMIALGIAPGSRRRFGFERFTAHDAPLWQRLLRAARERERHTRATRIYASDVSGRELAMAKKNIASARLEHAIHLSKANVLEVSPPAPHGVLIANPPYGVRLGEDMDLAEFYPRLGDALKQRFSGWRCYLFSADANLPRLIHLKAARRTPLFNGPLECRLYEYRMVAGVMGA
ncbi:MAG: class I SAM-dependent RNA methyltransferase [Betaproteobacteria bacterium]|nr:class I SAM-dependent RNA methyltransferase [Betaproteobacteria bacterium]MBI2959383.1 class I SAM-dependent RNA methyltransferase [Betaproteobacteria bacterium]